MFYFIKLMKKRVLFTTLFCCIMNCVFADATLTEEIQKTEKDTSVSIELNEVVVTGTGTLNRLKNSPIVVDVITQDELECVNTPSFEMAMQTLNPSFSFMTNAMGSYMQMNGLSNRYILVLVDGKKLAGDVSGNTDLSRIDMGNVKRIEVLKGAGSALYGSEAIGGVINIITNSSQENINISSNTRYGEYGQFTQNIHADFNCKWFSSSTSYQRSQSDGWQLNPYEINSKGELIETNKKAVNTNYSDVFNQKFTINANENLSLYVEGSLFDKKLKRPISAYSYDMRYTDYNFGGGARYLLNNSGIISLDFYTDNYEYFKDYIKKEGDFEDGDESKERRQKYYDTHLKGVFNIGKHNRLSVGSQYQIDYIESQSDVKDGSRDIYTYSIYAQDEIKLLDDKLQLVPGVRYVNNEAFGSKFTPKLAVMYDLNAFKLRASYAAGFRSPDMKELYTQTITRNTLSLGNPNLEAETSNYYSLNVVYHNDFMSLSVTGFINEIKNLITTEDKTETITAEEAADGITKKRLYMNTSEAYSKGLELALNTNLGYGLSLGLGYNFTDTKDKETGNPIIRSSKHIGTGNINWNKKTSGGEYNINFNGRIQSKRFMGENEYTRPYNQWNLSAYHKIKSFDGITLEPGFGIENIFNFVDDQPFGGYYATLSPGRTIYVSLKMTFKK